MDVLMINVSENYRNSVQSVYENGDNKTRCMCTSYTNI